jgi:hypothetical protein
MKCVVTICAIECTNKLELRWVFCIKKRRRFLALAKSDALLTAHITHWKQYWYSPKIAHLELIPRWAQKCNYIWQYRHNCQLKHTPLDDDSAVMKPWDLLLDIAVSTFSFSHLLNTYFLPYATVAFIEYVAVHATYRRHSSQTDSRAYLASEDLFPGVNRPGSEATHWPPSTVGVKNVWSYRCFPPPWAGIALCCIRTTFPFNPDFLSVKR